MPLHNDRAPTLIEREILLDATAKFDLRSELPLSVLAAEMVALGIPTFERAEQIALMHFQPGGPPPVDVSAKPSLAFLIQRYASRLTTPELLMLIQKHHPAITIPEIVAELEQQAESNFAEAAALEAEAARQR
jgi:hypothetical protein